MAPSILTNGSNKAQETLNSSGDAKRRQIDNNPLTKNFDDTRMTTDYGVKQTNTDDWLKVSTEDQTGPMLLEDNWGREKVSRKINTSYLNNTHSHYYTDSPF